MSFNTKILDFAKSKLSSKHGDGECWTLVESALKKVNAKTSSQYYEESGKSNSNFPSADYVWGRLIGIKQIQAGDLVQFSNHHFRVDMKNGSWATFTRSHHSAIVKKVLNAYSIEVYEQNVGTTRQEKDVSVRTVYIANIKNKNDIKNINVTGKIWFYRAEPKG